MEAISELVWNGLDAEADQVDIAIETTTAGPRELRHVTRVVAAGQEPEDLLAWSAVGGRSER